jgi:hypothetical protein
MIRRTLRLLGLLGLLTSVWFVEIAYAQGTVSISASRVLSLFALFTMPGPRHRF